MHMKKEKKVPFYMVVFYVLVAFSLVVWIGARLQTIRFYDKIFLPGMMSGSSVTAGMTGKVST